MNIYPVKRMKMYWCGLLLLLGMEALPLQAKTADEYSQAVLQAGKELPAGLVDELFNEKKGDIRFLNDLRLQLKASEKTSKGAVEKSVALFKALYEKDEKNLPTAYNAALVYIDYLYGKGLATQGWNATRSLEILEKLLQDNSDDWVARYIQGMNHVHWPKWFKKTGFAKDDFSWCVERSQQPDAKNGQLGLDEKVYHLGYIGLSDTLVLLGETEEALKVLQQARERFGELPQIKERLVMDQAKRVQFVTELRNIDYPVDTSLDFLWKYGSAGAQGDQGNEGAQGAASGDAVSATDRALQEGHKLNLVAGKLYGPGALEDQELVTGSLRGLQLEKDEFLRGRIAFFNNGAEEPNAPGEIKQFEIENTKQQAGKKHYELSVDGKMSDGTPLNENVDVGQVTIMGGRFNMLMAAVGAGPHEGHLDFFLDEEGHWNLQDDAAVDPGFAQGVIHMDNFWFSTRPRLLPFSTQTQMKYPAGHDFCGSVPSGSFVEGYLGDDDLDGFIDGRFNAVGNFPLESVLYPGAPYAQTRTLKTDVPVNAVQALYLTFANFNGYVQLTGKVQDHKEKDLPRLREILHARMPFVLKQQERAASQLAELDKAGWEKFQAGVSEIASLLQGDLQEADLVTLRETAAKQLDLLKRHVMGPA